MFTDKIILLGKFIVENEDQKIHSTEEPIICNQRKIHFVQWIQEVQRFVPELRETLP